MQNIKLKPLYIWTKTQEIPKIVHVIVHTLISKTVYTYYCRYFYIVHRIYMLVSPDAHLEVQFRKTFDNQQLLTS